MNRTASSTEGDEFAEAGLAKAPSELVKPPRVAAAHAHFECRYLQSVRLPENDRGKSATLILGQVVGIHIDEAVLTDGLVDAHKLRLMARLGYKDYAVIDQVFQMDRPG